MKLKRDTKFGEKSTCCFKIGVRNLTNFELSTQKSQRFSLYGLLLRKVYIVWAKKVQRSYLSWQRRVMQNLKKNWLVAWKMTWGIRQIFTRALESDKIGTLMGSFCPKKKMYRLKIYSGAMCHDNEEWYKTCRGTDVLF